MKVHKPREAEDESGNHSHAWHGAWNRPVYVDEDKIHPFEVARMTDHNVRGGDRMVTIHPLPPDILTTI